MPSTPTARLRLDKQDPGDNPNAWGQRLNACLDLIDQAFGVKEIPVNANVTLTANNYIPDQARSLVLRFTGTGGFAVTIPSVEKAYLIDNRCSSDVILKTASTPGATVLKSTIRMAYCDGATVFTDNGAGATAQTTSFDPRGSIAATNVQGAIAELDDEKAALSGATFTGAVGLKAPGQGGARFFGGGTERSGLVEFIGPDGTRHGYIGNSDGNRILLSAEVGDFAFDKPFKVMERPVYGGNIYAATGADVPLSEAPVVVLFRRFVATSPAHLITISGCASSDRATEVFWRSFLFDETTVGAVFDSPCYVSAEAGRNFTARVSHSVTIGLVPGRQYVAQILASCGQFATVAAKQTRIDIVSY